jgi:hypothetical protein
MSDSKKRVRSPKFPFIDLQVAIQRAETFYQSEKRNSANISVAMQSWGYKDESSGGFQTISTLKEFDLMEDSGSGEARRVKLTDRALRIILDKREGSAEREQLIREAALLPKTYSALWQRYEGELPSDSNLRHYLLFDYETPFNENSVDEFIANFRATVTFAKLIGSGTISPGHEDTDQEKPIRPKVGDFVQWESQGVLQFPGVRRVTGFSEDGEWAFVDGSGTGVPVKELAVEDSPATSSAAALSDNPEKIKAAPRLPPSNPQYVAPSNVPPMGTRQDVFSLAEGSVTIQWPAALSRDSFEDLAAWLDILKRKIGRSVEFKPSPREIIAKMMEGYQIHGDPESDVPCSLINPGQTSVDSVLLFPSQVLRELLAQRLVVPTNLSATGKRYFGLST